MSEKSAPNQRFDINMFMDIYGTREFAAATISVIDSDDDLTSVLKLHLLTERLLEAWICGRTEVDVFSSEGEPRCELPYSSKLSLAARLGFPLPAYNVLKKLNKMRNEFAHRLSASCISDNYLDSMLANTEMMPLGPDMITIKEMGYQRFTPTGDTKVKYMYSEENTPSRIKLLLIYTSINQRIFYYITQHTDVFSKSSHPAIDKYRI